MPCATAFAPIPACVPRSTRSGRTCASMRTSPSARRRSTSTRRAKRCSSAAGGVTSTWRRCARISPPACSRSPAGRRARRCSTRCAAPARSRSRPRSPPRTSRPDSSARFGFQKLAWYDGPTWQRMRQRARDRMRAAPSAPSIFASDIDPRAVAQCRRNAAAAGVAAWIDVREADVLARSAPGALRPAGRQSALWRAARGRGRARGVLSEIGRCAEAALRRLDRMPPDRRHAPAEADRPQALEANAALQRRHRMPAVPLRDRERTAAARDARGPAGRRPNAKIRLSTPLRDRDSLRHADASRPPLRIGTHPVHSRDEGQEARARAASSGKAGRSGGTSAPRTSPTRKTMDEGRVPQAGYVYQGQD